TILVHDNSVIKAAAASKTRRTQCFYFTDETKGAGTRHRLDVRVFREIDFGKICRGIDGRMPEIDGKRQRKPVVGLQTSPLEIIALTLADLHSFENLKELLGCRLLLQAGGTQ